MPRSVSWRFAALIAWPGTPTPSSARRRAPFRATYESTRRLLERELAHLGASNVLLEADCDPSQVRLDGQLRAVAKLRGPGVVITARVGDETYRFPCDRYLHWDDNLRAIALTLKNLRAVKRHGVVQRNEQYAGWKAVPPTAGPAPARDFAWAIAVIMRESGRGFIKANDRIEMFGAWRAARAKAHPDAGGSHQRFTDVEEAARLLGLT